MIMSTQSSGMDPARSRLRATVATVGDRIAVLLEGREDDTASMLTTAWADLVAQLALGPEPAVRTCPHCGGLGFRQATVCGSCWKKLTPPADD